MQPDSRESCSCQSYSVISPDNPGHLDKSQGTLHCTTPCGKHTEPQDPLHPLATQAGSWSFSGSCCTLLGFRVLSPTLFLPGFWVLSRCLITFLGLWVRPRVATSPLQSPNLSEAALTCPAPIEASHALSPSPPSSLSPGRPSPLHSKAACAPSQ